MILILQLEKYFLERMNRARNNYLKYSQNARIQFEDYMNFKKDINNYSIKDFERSFKYVKNAWVKSANEVKRAKKDFTNIIKCSMMKCVIDYQMNC